MTGIFNQDSLKQSNVIFFEIIIDKPAYCRKCIFHNQFIDKVIWCRSTIVVLNDHICLVAFGSVIIPNLVFQGLHQPTSDVFVVD